MSTKQIDWTRFTEMTPAERSQIHTESTFAELRENKEDKDHDIPDKFGLGIEDEVNIEWPNK